MNTESNGIKNALVNPEKNKMTQDIQTEIHHLKMKNRRIGIKAQLMIQVVLMI